MSDIKDLKDREDYNYRLFVSGKGLMKPEEVANPRNVDGRCYHCGDIVSVSIHDTIKHQFCESCFKIYMTMKYKPSTLLSILHYGSKTIQDTILAFNHHHDHDPTSISELIRWLYPQNHYIPNLKPIYTEYDWKNNHGGKEHTDKTAPNYSPKDCPPPD